MGSKGVVIATSAFGPNTNTNQNVGSNGSQPETPDIIFKSIPALTPPSEIVNTNGAGDSFMGGLMAQLSRSDYNFKNTENKLPLEKLCEFVQKAQRASIKSLQSECAVNSDITPELFD
ncbi:hypothetical protein AX774_g7654 [Zancudomyces culisetae]|uniref:Carbohydrate kinase PfkB domain-containing protein n=1 Tax=Zancudomyces culisetae TaxID=1213189 RepID=A0A1R1PD88_ZANCU|nr:hypothetical protein AX774_g7654 [Zancudomyces culisetae]|eukprot:OMH78937.1 hypothetical protein AX774_g7654 [Zancudomyces culisetae]